MVRTKAWRLFCPCFPLEPSSTISGPNTFSRAPAAHTYHRHSMDHSWGFLSRNLLGRARSRYMSVALTWVWISELLSRLTREGMALLSRMIRRLATSLDTFCSAPATEPDMHPWLLCNNLIKCLIPPFLRMIRMESTSELMLCKAPTALALTWGCKLWERANKSLSLSLHAS